MRVAFFWWAPPSIREYVLRHYRPSPLREVCGFALLSSRALAVSLLLWWPVRAYPRVSHLWYFERSRGQLSPLLFVCPVSPSALGSSAALRNHPIFRHHPTHHLRTSGPPRFDTPLNATIVQAQPAAPAPSPSDHHRFCRWATHITLAANSSVTRSYPWAYRNGSPRTGPTTAPRTRTRLRHDVGLDARGAGAANAVATATDADFRGTAILVSTCGA